MVTAFQQAETDVQANQKKQGKLFVKASDYGFGKGI